MKLISDRTFESLKPGLSSIDKYKLPILAVFLFILYFSNNAYVTSGDAVPAILLPWAILDEHTIVLDDFTGFIITQWSDHYFVVLKQGHLVSTTPIVTPLLAVPFYVPAYLLGTLSGKTVVDFSDSFISATDYSMKLAAVTIAVLSVVILYLLLKRMFDEQWAFILSLCYAVGTSTWTISSQSLWQHGAGELLIVCCYYLVIRNIAARSNINMLGMGALSALAFFNRPTDAILLLPVAYYIIKERCWQAIPAAIILGLPFLMYNMYFFSSIFGGYGIAVSPSTFTITSGVSASSPGVSASSPGTYDNPYLMNVLWHFIDFNTILLLYTPVSILAIAGIIHVLRKKDLKGIYKEVNVMAIVSLLLFIIFFGLYVHSSGWGYGPRFWTDAMPLVILLIGWSKTDGVLYKSAFICLALVSFIIQAYGAYFYLTRPF